MSDLSGKLERTLVNAVDRQEVAGVNILVLRDGKEAAYAQAGYADIEKHKAYERDTISRMYSMTKPVTAAAAMLLMERGMLDPGADVEEFLPGFHNAVVEEGSALVPAKRPVHIGDLLNMTSGLSYGGNPKSVSSMETEKLFERMIQHLSDEEAFDTVKVANKLGLTPLAFHPGEAFQYGTSADVLGAVIEVISGKRFGQFLQEELFEPLGMKDTAFYVPKAKRERLAKVYESTPDGLVPYYGNYLAIMNTMEVSPAFESGGAGLVSTVDDYARFATMLLNDGTYKGKHILAPRTVKYMTQASLQPWQQDVLAQTWDGLGGFSYGNLMRVMKEPSKACMMATKGEYGWDGWLGAYFVNSPKDHLTVVMSCQRKDSGTTSLTRRLRNIVWSSLCEA